MMKMIVKRRNYLFTPCLALLALMQLPVHAAPKDDSHMEWWRDARYGMFIHWGLYSVAGGEWKGEDYGKEEGGASAEWLMDRAKISSEEYRNTLAPKFNPTQFDAKAWVSIAKTAGMKYMVITSKHHDGFALFETEASDYDVMDASPFKRDIIKELSEECAKQGLRFGVYYSQNQDWYHRGNSKRGNNNPGTMSNDEYLELVKTQLDEILSNYGDMAVLWFDTGGANLVEANAQGARVRELQPNTVICSRLYSRKVPKGQQIYADFKSLPDRTIAAKRMTEDAESCMTMRHNWGYDQDDDNWKTPKEIIEMLALNVARGVNFLLNVGPSPEGTLCTEEIERLKEVGEWMMANGESIYGTNSAPVDFDFPWGAMTQKDQTVYLHVLKWNADEIEFNGLLGKPARVYFLADPEKKVLPVNYDEQTGVTSIEVPTNAPDPRNTVIAVEYDAPVKADPKAKGKYYWSKGTGVKHNKHG